MNNNIVIISPYLFRLTRGVERFTLSLAGAFADKGYRVIIYTWGCKHETACGKLDPRIKVRRVPWFRWYQVVLARACYRLWLRMDNPAATVLNFLYHGEETLPKRRKYLYVLHSPASQVPKRYEFVREHIGAFSDIHVVAISKMVEEEARPYIKGKPMSLIYNGTDTDTFRPVTQKEKSDKLRIITAAAFEERKGMHYLIEALAGYEHADSVQYDIYGSGDTSYESRLRKLIADNHLEGVVSLKGSVDNIAQLMPTYDLFALLSKGEAFALSPIEALACGVPIMVSDCPPYPEFVEDSFGCMVRRENPEEIRRFLTKMLTEPDALRQMSVAARRKGEEYAWSEVVRHYIGLIKS